MAGALFCCPDVGPRLAGVAALTGRLAVVRLLTRGEGGLAGVGQVGRVLAQAPNARAAARLYVRTELFEVRLTGLPHAAAVTGRLGEGGAGGK